MTKLNDIYTKGNDYFQGNNKFDVHPYPYYDGIYHTVKDIQSLNKRVINKPQSEWEQTENGLIFSKDYAVVDDNLNDDDNVIKTEEYTVILSDTNGNTTNLVMNFVNIPEEDVSSVETVLTPKQ